MTKAPIGKVLIYRLGSLGDMVVALPSLHLIARRFPDAERRLLTNFPVNAKAPAAAAVLGESGLVHGYMQYTVGTRSVRELLRLRQRVYEFRPDIVVFLTYERRWRLVQRDLLFIELCGVQRIVGVPNARALKPLYDAATGLYESEAHRLARLLGELGDAKVDDPANWDLRLTPAEREVAVRKLLPVAGQPLLMCAPGCKMQANDWEVGNWRALMGRLGRRYPHYALVMLGAAEDSAYCNAVAEVWPGARLNLAGQLTPRESAAVFAHAELFLGPDSGPKHLAASVGVPCVCVFGARNPPGIWFPPGDKNEIIYHTPECAACRLETCTEMQKRCVRSVTVAEMEQAVERVLSRVHRAAEAGKLIPAGALRPSRGESGLSELR